METEIKLNKSLPPLVEGKIHGNLEFLINEVFWIKRSPGAVTVVASWWGERSSAQFRLIDSTDIARANEDTMKVYAIKTNAALFEDYIRNCKTIELVVISEETRKVVGTAHIGELFKILTCKLYSQYAPILNSNFVKVGVIHFSLQLTYLEKSPNLQLKMYKSDKNRVNNNDLLSTANLEDIRKIPLSTYKDLGSKKNSVKLSRVNTFDICKPILKDKESDFRESREKFNEIIMDKLVTQIVARTQRLRGAILKETYNEDPLTLSDNSENSESFASQENEAKFLKYILGNETTVEEKKSLDTFGATSPTSSLINLPSNTIISCKYDNVTTGLSKDSPVKLNISIKDALHKETTTYPELKGTHPLDHVDSIRIFIKSFTLSSAGYRRAKSTCLQYGTPISLTYFIKYDTTFGSTKQTDVKCNKDIKFARTCAKKQVAQVIDFNHEGVYSINRHAIKRNFSLKFKVLVRHHNKKSSTELGCGCININDIVHTTNLSSTQPITIINKGLKIGKLEVTTELGCNRIHFGKEFIDTVITANENTPILEIQHLARTNNNKHENICKYETGTHSPKSINRISPVSTKKIKCLVNNNSKDIITAKDIIEHKEQNLDNKKMSTRNSEIIAKDKVLLHGLIYVTEGKNLPESNTYLICRAFWREDKATSQICSNTKNPLYHFCQLVPLIHDTELLERIKDNYIIIEVYSRQNNGETDNLLGIAKLPVHQLYIAYRNPLVLPHLLLSKYPVISVDGWVNINDLVSGKSCGELLTLVALGTAEQIALLKISRGLRNANIITQQTSSSHQCCISNDATCTVNSREILQCNTEVSNDQRESIRDNNYDNRVYNMSNRNLITANYKNQEIQTDISVLTNEKIPKPESQIDMTLRESVDSTTNSTLHVNKAASMDRSVQTEINQIEKREKDEEEINKEKLCLNRLNSNVLSDDNDSSPRNNFQLLTEMYRSVGVGAEYDEASDQQQTNVYSDNSNSSANEGNTEKDESNANSDNLFSRVVVEIECAVHLPKIERLGKLVEPSTYVTFQDFTLKSGSNGLLNPYKVTNIYPRSCNPKWNWRCDANLSTELLLNNEKRLILKVWNLIESDATVINLDKDTVIGFVAVDLSVLRTGLPTISGWFQIIDFSGKCNGRIKISITPLDNLSSLGKCASISTTNSLGCINQDLPNWSYSSNMPYNNTETNDAQYRSKHSQTECVQDNEKQNDSTCAASTVRGLGKMSISTLSLSLKEKLDELNEITERLQSRLRDVTNMAFEDEFDSDFEINESSNENECTDGKNAAEASGSATIATNPPETSKIPKQCKPPVCEQASAIGKRSTSLTKSNDNLRLKHISDQGKTRNVEAIDTGYSSSSNTSQFPEYYQYPCNLMHNYLLDGNAEYPARGTKTHINNLLDKLSLNLPPRPLADMNVPMKRDIISLFTKLQEYRSNAQNTQDNRHDVNACSASIQIDNMNAQNFYPDASRTGLDVNNGCAGGTSVSGPVEELQSCSKISTVIREELVAEENGDIEWDELTTYLISTNIRYRNVDGTINPLLYHHLVPDLQATSAVSPEEEAAERLDNRYAKSFGVVMNRGTHRSAESDAVFPDDAQTESRKDLSEPEENIELLRVTRSDVSGSVGGNIDVSVPHKSSDRDLVSDNGVESIATSSDKFSSQQVDVETENCCFSMSESSVPGISRQAPDGGNPVEESKTIPVMRTDYMTRDILDDSLRLSDSSEYS